MLQHNSSKTLEVDGVLKFMHDQPDLFFDVTVLLLPWVIGVRSALATKSRLTSIIIVAGARQKDSD